MFLLVHFLILMMAVLSSCVSVPWLSQKQMRKQNNSLFLKIKASIYIYRNESLGSAVKVGITLDGKMIGNTARHTYFSLDVEPGKHQVACVAESTFLSTLKPLRAKLFTFGKK